MAAMLQRGQGEDRYASALREGRYIVFNMKGESLFFLDCDSEDWLKADEADRQMWSSMYSAMDLILSGNSLWITSITVESLKALAPGYSKNQTLSQEVTLEKFTRLRVGFHGCYSIPPFRTGAGPGRNVHESKHAASTFQCAGEMEELLERLVFDVDAAVTEFTRKGTIGNRTVGRAGDKRDIFIRALQNIKCSIPDNVYERVRLVLYACNEDLSRFLVVMVFLKLLMI